MLSNDPARSIRSAQRAAAFSLCATVAVVAVKFGAAFLSHSISVLAEALQSTMDILMALVTVATLRYVARPPDEDHPYGHGKAEFLSSAFQMIVMMGAGAFIIFEAYKRWLRPEPILWDWGAAAMVYTLASNVVMMGFLKKVGNATHSAALASEATHLRGDAMTCTGVFVGMVLVGVTRNERLDPAFAICFAAVAIWLGYTRLRHVLHPLMDGALPAEDLQILEGVLKTHAQVRGYHNLRARQVGANKTVELHVTLDDRLSFVEAHAIAEEVEADLRNALDRSFVTIHYEPHEFEEEHQAREHRTMPSKQA
jgi:cation diffusion facilitator family transporter